MRKRDAGAANQPDGPVPPAKQPDEDQLAAAPPVGPSVVEVSPGEEILLARLIQAEAEGEPMEGKIAVGAVVVNRVLHPDFPPTITGVILQERQFESTFNGRLEGIRQPGEDCLEAARRALAGEDPTGGALYFYNPRLSRNAWLKARPPKVALGKHLFLG